MRMTERIKRILSSLKQGKYIITPDDVKLMNAIIYDFLYKNYNHPEDVRDILEISNILYNNSTNLILPLEDGIYDLAVVKYDKMYGNSSPVGAIPVNLKITDNSDITDKPLLEDKKLLDVVSIIPEDRMKDMVFFNNIMQDQKPIRQDFFNGLISESKETSKVMHTVPHTYPELVGTLHKCKFTLMSDAREAHKEDDDSVKVFERDFFYPTYGIAAGYALQKNPSQNPDVGLIAELKYDGVSIEAEVEGDTIVSAVSRGDTANNIASDYTPIFGGKKFPRAYGMPKDQKFGIKFEAIVTNENLRILSTKFGIEYKNARVAIIGLLGRLDGYKFRDMITLVPIRTAGLRFDDPIQEVNFLNKYYSSGVAMKYAYLHGDYYSLLWQVKKFVDDAEYMRAYMPFMYDGVVISYIDPDVRLRLGRQNSIDLWSMAIKFNPLAKQTIFLGYKYTVGQDGRITPMAYFNPVEFMGSVHDKTTVHSYRRFKELALRPGDIITITYVNDVICYLKKPYNAFNDKNTNPVIEFPEVCPSCGRPLTSSDSGDSAYCLNPDCPERVAARVGNMLKKLGIKDFGRAYTDKLGITGLTSFLNMDRNRCEKVIGPVMTEKLFERINELKTSEYPDYKLVGSIGFDSISIERWRVILNNIKLSYIISASTKDLRDSLQLVKTIGPTIADSIINGRMVLREDLYTISQMKNVKSSYRGNNIGIQDRKSVRFTGFRSEELTKAFNDAGFDADGNKSVTKKTDILIIPYYGFDSTKLHKISPTCRILDESDAWRFVKQCKPN